MNRRKFHQVVLHSRSYGSGATGESKYREPLELRCRIQPISRLVTTQLGQQVLATSFLMVSLEADIKPDDRIAICGKCYHVQTVEEIWGLQAPSHKEVYLG